MVVLAWTTMAACSPKLLPNSNLEDSEENRQVLLVLAKYQAAMIERRSDAVMELVAADYFEDRGNLNANDDYNRDGLQQRLKDDFARFKEVDLQIYVQKIDRANPEKLAVDYRYQTRALLDLPAGPKWVTSSDVNRLWLRPVGDGDFRIVAGL
jgi:hypothetical protein